jgi:uncharacterized protein involved in tolerance to divalent cations
MILAYIISNSKDEAEMLALDLLEEQLVYSVNLLPDIISMRWANGEIKKLNRTIVLAKTKSLLYKKIEDEVNLKQTSGTAIVFTMPITQTTQELFDDIQKYTLKV